MANRVFVCSCPEARLLKYFLGFVFQLCLSSAGSETSVEVLLEEGAFGIFLKNFVLFLRIVLEKVRKCMV